MVNNTETQYENIIAFHPGSYVEDIIDDLNITQEEFAKRLGTSAKTISKLINGKASITKDLAYRLSKLTGSSIELWINLQAAYDLKIKEIEESKSNREIEISEFIDFSYFKKNKFITDGKYSLEEKIKKLRVLFSVSNLDYFSEFNPNVSYRNYKGFDEKVIINSNIMLELATIKAREKAVKRFDNQKFKEILPEIRNLTTKKEFYPELIEKLEKCGIILVGLPGLKNSNLHGATKKFNNGAILVLITDRNKSSDIFWFSLFHEFGHICNDDFYSNYKDLENYKLKEIQADQFAADYLIPSDEYNKFIGEHIFTKDSINEFSREIKIHPSIVLGRLQRERFVDYSQLNSLKINYNIILN